MKKYLLLALAFGSMVLQAAVTVPDIFSDRAVLARHENVPVFGGGSPGEKVTVKFNDQIRETIVGTDGKWEVALNLKNSPVGPFKLHINDRVFSDVIVGEVFLLSGQSNAEYLLRNVAGLEEAIRLPENRLIRHFKVKNTTSAVPVAKLQGQWVYANSRNLPSFSALGYFFAKKLHDTLHVPVGIVNSSWGGTYLESWMSQESVAPFPAAVKIGEKRLADMRSYPERFKKFLAQTAAWEQKYGRTDSPVKFPGKDALWQEHSGSISGGGICWLRNKITLSEADVTKGFQIYLGRLYAPAKVYIDGVEVLNGDVNTAWSHKPFGTWVKPGRFTAGEHEVMIRYWISHDNMHLPQPFRFGSCKIDGKNWEIYREKSFPKCTGEMRKTRPVQLGNAPGTAGQWYHIYNAMIHPLFPFRFAGVLWYQGEANATRYQGYGELFSAMITDWRQKFRDEKLPFFFCQLAAFMDPASNPDSGYWQYLRQEQSEALQLPHTGMVVITDAGEIRDIHPRNKQLPGERLAALALNKIYGRNVPCTSPTAVKSVRHNGIVTVSFSHTDGGLTAAVIPAQLPLKTGNQTFTRLIRRSPAAQLEGFALCGADGKWFWADKAEISGETVVVSSNKVAQPVKIRYNWSNFPIGNLFSRAGFPIAPFETPVTE